MSERINILLVLIPALPLAACLITAVLGPRVLRQASHLPTIVAIVGAFLCSLLLLNEVRYQHSIKAEGEGFSETITLWEWVHVREAYQQHLWEATPVADGSDQASPLIRRQESPPTRVARTSSILRDFTIGVTLRADALTAVMLAMVTFISSLVAIYSAGYMHAERGYWRFFCYISLFVFSMTMLVSVSNFLMLYVFWEAVGVCSYLLIGFWYEKPAAAAAGKKAFLVNRIGDFGFAIALFLIWTTFGTLNFDDVLGAESYGFVSPAVMLSICLLLLLGACGKSAQFPLHVWLPDAMEGPSPVSALIHAATMVTAGVYMVARCTPLFMASPDAQLAVAVIGGFTALLAALIAITQFDLKRVLAYSTISQLGYMFLALGCGTLSGVTAGMFHLFTHAFFKALLFLGAGSVMHAMGGEIDMRRFSGLRRLMPITCATFAVGCIALSGLPPLAGFFSKDAILAAVAERAQAQDSVETNSHGAALPSGRSARAVLLASADADHPAMGASRLGAGASRLHLSGDRRRSIYRILYYGALFTAFLTALYTFRAFFMTFFGPERVPREAAGHAHESPRVMWIPLAMLAFCACLVGPLGGAFGDFLTHTPSLAPLAAHAHGPAELEHGNIAVVSTLVALAGSLLAAYLYLGHRGEAEWLAALLKRRLFFFSPYTLSYKKFYFDEIYAVLLVWPLRILAAISFFVDRWVIDQLVNFCGWLPRQLGSVMRSMQIGLVQFYALAMVLGLLVIIAVKVVWNGGG